MKVGPPRTVEMPPGPGCESVTLPRSGAVVSSDPDGASSNNRLSEPVDTTQYAILSMTSSVLPWDRRAGLARRRVVALGPAPSLENAAEQEVEQWERHDEDERHQDVAE